MIGRSDQASTRQQAPEVEMRYDNIRVADITPFTRASIEGRCFAAAAASGARSRFPVPSISRPTGRPSPRRSPVGSGSL